jgi:hypothetical protein
MVSIAQDLASVTPGISRHNLQDYPEEEPQVLKGVRKARSC